MTPYTGGGTPAVMTTADDGTTTLTATRSDGANFAGVSSGFLDPGVMGGAVAYTVTFNVPITVSSLQIGEFTNNSTSNHYVMTPNVGTPWSIADNDGAIVGAIATHTPSDWVGVTSITYSYSVNNWRVGIDNLVFTVSAPPSITSANYDANTGILAVTAPSMSVGDTIDVSKLTLTGRNDGAYTLTSSNVTASSSSTFSVTLNAADKLAINGLLNQNGFDAINGSVYNLAAAVSWNATRASPADLTGNSITVSNVSAPSVTSATYDSSTHVLTATGTNFVGLLGANNDIRVSLLTITGEGGTPYTLTSPDVEVISSTAFSVTLNATDYAMVETIFNKTGSNSTSGTSYNLAAADDWNSEITGGNIADASNAVTVSNVPFPSISSATYNASSGMLVVTGSGLVSKAGALNDIDVSKLTISGDANSYALTSASVELTNGSSFSITLNSTDKDALISRLNKNGTSSTGAVTYNIAAAEDWNRGADLALDIADLTGNGITVSNAATIPDAPLIGTATAGDTQASVSFTAPVSNGGAAITAYTVTANPSGFTATGSSSPLTVTGLTNGTAYSFTVTATNIVGISAASAASNSVIPKVANSAPVATNT
ncbi:fibronectin type III domain-containing protein, partial [Shewanella sp. SR44-3]|uniref:beta strand repeat-containing protein n=1 Tax=Shewanella sp. SR44-3 TaxID=2760936 RepID=UPI0015F9BF9A